MMLTFLAATILTSTLATQAVHSSVELLQPVASVSPDGRPLIEFYLRNRSPKTITAWEVSVEIACADGTSDELTLTREGFGTFEGVIPPIKEGNFIKPGASVHATMLVGERPGSPSFGVKRGALLWAIFENGTWLGDSARADRWFKRRQADKQTLDDIVAVLRDALTQGGEALELSLRGVGTPVAGTPDHALKKRLRDNLLSIEKEKTSQRMSDAQIRNAIVRWLEWHEELRAAADKHSRPKPWVQK